MNAQAIMSRAQEHHGQMLEWYRTLHRHPEVSRHEVWTNAYLREQLNGMEIPFFAPAPNITIALIDSGLPGATVGLRCDTDALPVKEETGLDYASEQEGVMHACGHDAHMTIGLAAAKMLMETRGEWQGKVKLIFQPAEEGEAGASDVIRTGLANDVDVFFGIHVWSPFPSGELHVSPVTVSAAVDMFRIVITGRGGHGATPEKCADAVVAASAVVMGLQSIISRRLSPLEAAVLTLGSLHAGTAGNIIAPEAEIKGTIRSLNEETRTTVYQTMVAMTQQIASAYGCTAEVFNRRISDALTNDERASAIAADCARELTGQALPQRTMMLGDDFADYGAIAPYCYGQVGIADPAKETHYAHHNGCFRMDEDLLPLCAAWMTLTAMRYGAEWKIK